MSLLRTLLTPFSWVYGLGVAYRNMAYDRGWNPSIDFDLPVISIGNLKAGGTGKTPHIEYLIRLLRQEYRLASLSRGYGRKTTGYLLATAQSLVEDIGDEPKQLKQKFPSLEVAVGEQRASAIPALLLDEPAVEVVLLDDAFQHRAVRAGLNILLTCYDDLYTSDKLLPAGRLREPASSAERADIIVVTKCPVDMSAAAADKVRKQIQSVARSASEKVGESQLLCFSKLNYGAPVFLHEQALENNLDGVLKPPLNKSGKTVVFALSGIANPTLFEGQLQSLFPDAILRKIRFRDHHNFSERDIRRIAAEVQSRLDATKSGAAVEPVQVFTTEKDAMRLVEHFPLLTELGLEIVYLPIEVAFDQPHFDLVVRDFLSTFKPSDS